MRPKNTAKHEAYRRAFALLSERHPLLTRTQVIQRMHEIKGIPISTIRYYLREDVDHRRHYSEEDLRRLAVATPREVEAEATKRGVTPDAVRGAVRRLVGRNSQNTPLQEQAKTVAEISGYLEWSNGFALNAYKLTRRGVQTARRTLVREWGLDLAEPNYLVHGKTGRRIALRLAEQVRLIQEPVRFIKLQARELSERWEPAEQARETK